MIGEQQYFMYCLGKIGTDGNHSQRGHEQTQPGRPCQVI